jgi:hypothetical protein
MSPQANLANPKLLSLMAITALKHGRFQSACEQIIGNFKGSQGKIILSQYLGFFLAGIFSVSPGISQIR